jgi:hypothetical protein
MRASYVWIAGLQLVLLSRVQLQEQAEENKRYQQLELAC